MQGVVFVIDQLGQTIMQNNQQIATLTKQVAELQAQLAATETVVPTAEEGK